MSCGFNRCGFNRGSCGHSIGFGCGCGFVRGFGFDRFGRGFDRRCGCGRGFGIGFGCGCGGFRRFW